MSLKASSYTIKKPNSKTNSLSKPRSPGTVSPTKLPSNQSSPSLKDKRSMSGQIHRQLPTRSETSSMQDEIPEVLIEKSPFGPSFLAKDEKSIELNFTNLLADDPIIGGSSSNPLSRELDLLKKEVTRKNVLIENLMGENSELRHQMDAFLASVDRTQADIDGHLSECNQKIIDLELEVQKLREENKKIKDQFYGKVQKQITGLTIQPIGEENTLSRLEELGLGGNLSAANNKVLEDFLFGLTEKATEFMEYSKRKYEQFDRKVHLLTNKTQATSPTAKSPAERGLQLEKRPSGPGKLEAEINKKYQSAVPSKVFYLAQGGYNKPKASRLSQDTASTAAKKMARTLKTEEFSLEKRRSYNFD